MSYFEDLGDFYYTVLDAQHVPVSTGGVKDTDQLKISTLEQYNTSVLGPMQVPAGGRVVVFKNAGEQQSWGEELRKLQAAASSPLATAAEKQRLADFVSVSVTRGATAALPLAKRFPVMPVAIGVGVIALVMLWRKR